MNMNRKQIMGPATQSPLNPKLEAPQWATQDPLDPRLKTLPGVPAVAVKQQEQAYQVSTVEQARSCEKRIVACQQGRPHSVITHTAHQQ